MPMKPDIKAAWIAALRSRKYTQGKFVLRDKTDRYCCLGVLCEIAASDPSAGSDVRSVAAAKLYSMSSYLSPTIDEWLGFYKGGVDILPLSAQEKYVVTSHGGISMFAHTLSTLNDNGYTFKQIADIIEEHY